MMLKDVLKGTDAVWVRGKNADVGEIAIDDRKVKPGALYVCLKGLRHDGHSFARAAAEAGAAALLVSAALEDCPKGVAVAQVADTRKALAIAAANFYGRPADALNLIGVTGTKGKTSTTYMLEAILRQARRKAGVIGTLGAKINGRPLGIHYDTSTTPDPIELQQIFSAMKGQAAADVVMEVSSQALAFEKLEGLHFDTAIFTNLTQDHLDFHKTMENYLLAKAKLFQQCGRGVVNADSGGGRFIMENSPCECLTFGIDNECDMRAVDIEYLENGVSFSLSMEGEKIQFFVPIKGRFTVYNALAAIGAARLAKIPFDAIKEGLASMNGVPGRIQGIPNNIGAHVVVDYAHSPDSIVNIINAVREFAKGRVMIIFGCGGDRDASKRPIMGKLAGELADCCIITSDNPRGEDPLKIIEAVEGGVRETNCPYEVEADRREAIFKGVAALKAGDALIIAGKGHEDYQIIGDRVIHFDDAEVAREALGALG